MMDGAGRAQLFEILQRWRAGERERTLESLPLDDRRKLAVMETVVARGMG